MSLSIFAAAANSPDRLALVTDRDRFTFAELAHRVRPVVGWLRERDPAGDAPVAVVARNDLPTLELLHALIARATPVWPLHPRLTEVEREAVLEGAGAGPGLEAGAGPGLEAGSGPGLEADLVREFTIAPAAPDPPAPPDDERTLAVIQTSGTSGRPRGVILSRRAFAASAAASAANLGWRDDDRWLLPLPMAHVGGLSIVTRCLLARRPVVMAPATEPLALMDAVQRHRVTLLSLVPTLLARILDLDTGAVPPDHLRAVLLGGAAASPLLLQRAADRGWPILTTYGLSEACSQVTTQRYGTVNRGELGSGPPLPGTELRIGDDDEIQLRGPTLFSGYVHTASHHDDGSAEHTHRPFLDDGWFPTGDRGRLDPAGNLHVLGRRSDRIITGGENVDPVEVEQALERLPGVRQACVFGTPDEEWGEVVCAALVVEGEESGEAGPGAAGTEAERAGVDPGAAESLDNRVAGLREVLAPFKVPRRIAVLDALPLNANGKVDRAETAHRTAETLRRVRG